jgi:hypothetical protein
MDKNGYQAHPWYDAEWELKHIRDGKVIWSERKRNALMNEGEENMLRTYFRNEYAPTEFYVRLYNGTIVETDTLATLATGGGEPVGNGYLPFLLARSDAGWPNIENDAGDWRVISKPITFTASGGNIGPITTAFIATTSNNSGKLIAANGLSIVRTIITGDQLQGTIRVKLQ